ncbi:hypothetical protein [Acinetobacter brisouii]
MKRIILVAIFALASPTLFTGCAVVMAAKQPDKKDVSLLAYGMPRSRILAEFGPPLSSELKDGKRIDVYAFKQGYSKGAKVSRTIFHGAADIATLGLWEVIATPTESVFDGNNLAYQVTYDSADKVLEVIQLKK